MKPSTPLHKKYKLVRARALKESCAPFAPVEAETNRFSLDNDTSKVLKLLLGYCWLLGRVGFVEVQYVGRGFAFDVFAACAERVEQGLNGAALQGFDREFLVGVAVGGGDSVDFERFEVDERHSVDERSTNGF